MSSVPLASSSSLSSDQSGIVKVEGTFMILLGRELCAGNGWGPSTLTMPDWSDDNDDDDASGTEDMDEAPVRLTQIRL
jgi:hypothetical protein